MLHTHSQCAKKEFMQVGSLHSNSRSLVRPRHSHHLLSIGRLSQEMQLLSELRHENIVRFLGARPLKVPALSACKHLALLLLLGAPAQSALCGARDCLAGACLDDANMCILFELCEQSLHALHIQKLHGRRGCCGRHNVCGSGDNVCRLRA